jgi:polyferredoxin
MKKNFSISKNNNIIFGIVFFIFFLILGFHSVIVGEKKDIRIWSFILSLVFLVTTIIKPNLFTFPNRLWIQFGALLGKIISPIVMGLVFFSVLTPIGILVRILNKDIMGLKRTKNSYWIKREYKVQSMKKQF